MLRSGPPHRRLPRRAARRRRGRSGKFAWFVVVFGLLSAVALAVYGLMHGSFGPGAHTEWLEVSRELEEAGEPVYYDAVKPPELDAGQNFFATAPFDGVRDGAPASPLLQRAIDPGRGLSVAQLLQSASQGSGASLEAIAETMQKAGLVQSRKEFLLAGDRVIAAMNELGLDFSPLATVADLPGSRFPIDYSAPFPELPHLRYLEALGDWLAIRAIARVSTGDAEAASVDLMLIWRLADSVAAEPFLPSQRLRRRLLGLFAGCVRVGIAWGAWSDEELANFSAALERARLLTDLGWALRGERAQVNSVVQRAVSGEAPEATIDLQRWLGEDLPSLGERELRTRQVAANRAIQQFLDQISSADGFAPTALLPPESATPSELVLARMRELADEARVFAQIQTYLLQAQAACALERYHMEKGDYPATLADLVPAWLPAEPRDPVSGQPMSYALDKAHGYILTGASWETGKPWVWTRE